MARPKLDRPAFRLILRGSRFYVRWWQDGGWQRVSAGTADRREAERFLAQFEAGYATPEAPPQPTIGRIVAGYLADKKDRVRAFGTLSACGAHLARHLGDLQPSHLTRERCRFYAAQRRREGHMVGPAEAKRRKPTADGTIIRELVTLRAAIRWAIAARWLPLTDEPYVEVPRSPPPRDRWLTEAEADRLIEAAQAPHIKLFLTLALHTGARRQAILDLTWDRVDLEGRRITLGYLAGGKGRATVPINDPLFEALSFASQIATCANVVEHGSRQVGSVKTGTNAAAVRARLPGVTPHILRHTAATRMIQHGVSIAEVARFLGNTEKMVERVYGHHAPDYLKAAADALAGRWHRKLAPETPMMTRRKTQ